MPSDQDPMHDPVTRKLLAEAAVRLSSGYTACGDEAQANRRTRLAFVLHTPPSEQLQPA